MYYCRKCSTFQPENVQINDHPWTISKDVSEAWTGYNTVASNFDKGTRSNQGILTIHLCKNQSYVHCNYCRPMKSSFPHGLQCVG